MQLFIGITARDWFEFLRAKQLRQRGRTDVMYGHIHLISRRAGDLADRRGGVRGVIPGRYI